MGTVPIYTKDSLIKKLKAIRAQGWILSGRQGNAGGVGNTLEDLLGITENNLPIPNAAEWELKCQRLHTSSLTTLFHIEPSPRALKFVPAVLLPKYGWPHQGAGAAHGSDELSFRQTISGKSRSDRGFKVVINQKEEKVMVSFQSAAVGDHHAVWLKSVRLRAGLGELNPQPYWGFDDLRAKARTKLLNCFYVQAAAKRENGLEYFHFQKITMLQDFTFKGFLNGLIEGDILVDFDARSGHNHGTKFRLKQDCLPVLYSRRVEI